MEISARCLVTTFWEIVENLNIQRIKNKKMPENYF